MYNIAAGIFLAGWWIVMAGVAYAWYDYDWEDIDKVSAGVAVAAAAMLLQLLTLYWLKYFN